MSKRLVQGLLAGFCSVTVGLGSITKMEQAVSAAVAPAVDSAEAHVRAQAVVHPRRDGLARAWSAALALDGDDHPALGLLHRPQPGRRRREAAP